MALARAIVMAAGVGSRLRPVTERYAKPVLPIDGRPVVVTLLRDLAAAGIGRVALVVGHLAGQIEALVGDGSAFGVSVEYVSQPEPEGSADAVRRAVDAGFDAPALVSAADTVYAAGDVTRFVEAWTRSGAEGAIAVRRDPPPSPPHRWPVRIRDGLVVRVLDDDLDNPLAGAPLWVLGAETASRLCLDSPPWELANAAERAIAAGARIAGIEIGRTRDLTHPVDLVERNFPYLGAL